MLKNLLKLGITAGLVALALAVVLVSALPALAATTVDDYATGDGVNIKIHIDTMEEASAALVAVPNEDSNWILMQNSSLLSLELLKGESLR